MIALFIRKSPFPLGWSNFSCYWYFGISMIKSVQIYVWYKTAKDERCIFPVQWAILCTWDEYFEIE